MKTKTAIKKPPAPRVRAVEQIYQKYFQKSRAFVYPLLGLSRFVAFQPYQVYIEWPQLGYTHHSGRLIAVFSYEEREPDWPEYRAEKLLKNTHYEASYRLPDGKLAVVFNLMPFQDDINRFWRGNYSGLSGETKAAIGRFYGLGSKEWAHMLCYLEPHEHFGLYAKLLEIPERDLRDVGELCDRPNYDNKRLDSAGIEVVYLSNGRLSKPSPDTTNL